MSRTRISTTVDTDRLTDARRRLGASDSEVVDRALLALIDQLEAEREIAVLAEHPYDEDPDLGWQAPPGPDLAYDGEIPAEVLELATERRRREHPG